MQSGEWKPDPPPTPTLPSNGNTQPASPPDILHGPGHFSGFQISASLQVHRYGLLLVEFHVSVPKGGLRRAAAHRTRAQPHDNFRALAHIIKGLYLAISEHKNRSGCRDKFRRVCHSCSTYANPQIKNNVATLMHMATSFTLIVVMQCLSQPGRNNMNFKTLGMH